MTYIDLSPKSRTNPSNVIPLAPPFGRTIPRDRAGKFLLTIECYTDLLGGPFYDREYAIEKVLVDPDAEAEDGSLVVFQLPGGRPFLTSIHWTGRDYDGRFVPAGDPCECFHIFSGLCCARDETMTVGRIIGCLVGEPRRIPVTG